MSVLETERLTRRFGTMKAVDELSIQVAAGEIFGLIGPNGAGKTTTIKMLTTLLPPTSGRAEVNGFDIRRQRNGVRCSIGYVSQLLSSDGSLTGYENLLISAKLYDQPGKHRKKLVEDTPAFMGLTDSADMRVRSYSGGMIRRLEIGQAIMHRPRVLFMDEPTVGLDPVARRAVWERDLGILHKLLVSPDPRAALVLGKGISGGVRSFFQAVIVIILALLLGVRLNFNPSALAGMLLVVVLGASLFSTLSLIIACIVKTRERFMGIGQVLTMPLFFAGNALYPISLMPDWLQAISLINPLIYLVEALRTIMLTGAPSPAHGLILDIAVLLVGQIILIVIAARLYPKLAI